MTKHAIADKTIPEIQTLVKEGELSHADVVREVYDTAARVEPHVRAFITLRTQEDALAQLEALPAGAEDGLLSGIPISVKDTFVTKGIRTTVASKMLQDFVPAYSATAYERLESRGTVLVGKCNMDEFAHGFTTEYSALHITHNPWDYSLVPGGSSGGSAASVASRTSLLSLASENFGSVVQPAALCGVVGIKPTYGRSSRYGIIAMASSLECPGIIGRCVEDAAIGLSAIIGKDARDATSVDYRHEDLYRNLESDVHGKRIAVVRSVYDMVDMQLKAHWDTAIAQFKEMGVTVDLIDWYDTGLDGYIYDILYRAEVASNLARYDGVRYGYRPAGDFATIREYYAQAKSGFGKHVQRQIQTDPIMLSEGADDVYERALKMRGSNKRFIDCILEEYDAILSPTTTFVSLTLGMSENAQWREENRHLARINATMMCPTVLYGYPSISFPGVMDASGVPVGMHLYSGLFNEQKVCNLAYAFQEYTGMKMLKPAYRDYPRHI